MVTNPDSIGRDLVGKFYAAFEKRDLERVVDLFTHDAIIEIGASGSTHAVAYGGIVRGTSAIRDFYRGRFAKESHERAPIRPMCGFEPPKIHWPWIIITGAIRDQVQNGPVLYDGHFLHVWTADPGGKKFAALAMFLDKGGRQTTAG